MYYDNQRILTPKDIAKLWDCNIETVYKLLRTGEIKSFRTGVGKVSLYRILESDLDKYMKKDEEYKFNSSKPIR